MHSFRNHLTFHSRGVIFAAATVQLVPVVTLVVALQRYLVAGLTAGAVKA